MFARESTDVYEALVEDLSRSIVPTTIMGVTLVGIGILAATQVDQRTFLPVTIAAELASVAKASFIEHHRRALREGPLSARQTSRFEIIHMALTLAMAASVGWMGSLLFHVGNVNAHLLATALLFAYCSGIVSRLAIRPRIAIAAITTAAVPCLLSAFSVGGMAHVMLGVIFLVFLLGALETVAHSYRNAVHHISMRMQMTAIARHDPLTGLLNRFGLREAFALLPASRSVAMHAFDLDGFKPVNDAHGHEGGDAVLKEIALRLRTVARTGELVARVGGDEFVVVQPGVANEAAADVLARRIHDALIRPYDLAGHSVSIGYVISSSTHPSLDEMLRDADRASYMVKRDKGGFRPHRPDALRT